MQKLEAHEITQNNYGLSFEKVISIFENDTAPSLFI